MNKFNHLILLISLIYVDRSLFLAKGQKVYETPLRETKRSYTTDLELDISSKYRELITKQAQNYPPTPAEIDRKKYYRRLIEASKELSPYISDAYRLKRKKPADPDVWFDQLERIRKNSTVGRAEESIACESFGVNSNNFGNILLFEELITPRKQQNPKKKVCTRPDGLGVDKNGKVILFEVKVLRPNGLLSAGEQLKAQEKSVRNGRADRHVISMRCPECKNENQFPRPRRSFKKREMLTEFRFSSPLQSKHVYRWIWNKNHDDVLLRNNDIDGEWGVWQLVEEGSFIDGMSED